MFRATALTLSKGLSISITDKRRFSSRARHTEVDYIECHRETRRNGQAFQEFAGVAFANCTDCHEDEHDGRFGIACTDCHSVNGWSQLRAGNRFDHGLTHFPLEGQHQQVSCADSHTSGDYSQPIPFDNCTDCHEDYHEGDFTSIEGLVTDCDQCHDLQHEFSFSSFGLSDHQESDYPHEGAHLATPCFACHKPSEEQRWYFTLESESCVACHDNIHEGYMDEPFGSMNGCTECHNNDTWTSITFDHSRTDWPLEGVHGSADCRACHFSEDWDTQQFKGRDKACTECHSDESPTELNSTPPKVRVIALDAMLLLPTGPLPNSITTVRSSFSKADTHRSNATPATSRRRIATS
ncbi:MAG: hypothetical protein J4F31_05335 [Flavobacteriales bacterium]|nr:hypothetical protein [Flavobacteriales bacterium]